MQFDLKQQKCKLASFNSRSELKGEERVSASDLKLEARLPIDELVQFGSELRSAWYDEANGAARLRNPKLVGPFAFDDDCVGARVTVHYGLGGNSDLELGECTVNKFELLPFEGGTVGLVFRVQGHLEQRERGILSGLVQAEIELTVEAAQATLPGIETGAPALGREQAELTV